MAVDRTRRSREIARVLDAMQTVASRYGKPSHLVTRREYASLTADRADLPQPADVAATFGAWERARERAAIAGEVL